MKVAPNFSTAEILYVSQATGMQVDGRVVARLTHHSVVAADSLFHSANSPRLRRQLYIEILCQQGGHSWHTRNLVSQNQFVPARID
jgi:hypothetical protein